MAAIQTLSIKRRIRSAKNIAQVARAMEMISASKIKKTQKIAEDRKPHNDNLVRLTRTISTIAHNYRISHPYFQKNSSIFKLVVVISPDKGLCGALIANLFKKLAEIDSPDNRYILIGKKAQSFAKKLRGETVAVFPFGTRAPTFFQVREIVKIIDEFYLSQKVSSVEVVFSEFISIFNQKPNQKQILPILQLKEEIVDVEYILEPNPKEILTVLLPHYLEVIVYDVLLSSYVSEQAARMIAMQNAKNNAKEVEAYLTLLYNKARQEKITNEILDLSNNEFLIAGYEG
jgi:F-type H+-transporting ATPase subunit gamma